MTPSAVPYPAVASAPALQCVSIARILGHNGGAERPHRAAAGDVLVVNGLRFAVEAILDLVDRLTLLGRGRERSASSVRSPRTD